MLATCITRKLGILASQDSTRLGSADAAKSRTESFTQVQSPLLLTILFLDDETLPVYPNSTRGEIKRLDFMSQDTRINQSTRWDKKPCASVDESGGQLTEDNCLARPINKGVAGIWSSAPDTNVDVFLFGDEGGDFAFAFGTVLPANDNPQAHD
jgi:hypothetical protein